MNKELLNKPFQDFISENLKTNLIQLSLKGSPFKNISNKELIQQIEGKKIAKNKLPSWYQTSQIYYPPKINLEQTSSEITAQYKATLISGNSLADITGGFGVDSYFFSKYFKEVYHFEMDENLSKIAKHNFAQLNSSVNCFAGNGLEKIRNKHFDVLFVDPSRRNDLKGKVFYLNDCLPNVVEHLDYLMSKCNYLLIKSSPMLDISIGIKELKHVFEIHVVAVENEVKELLWLLCKNITDEIQIKTINIKKGNVENFESVLNQDEEKYVEFPEIYIYEPNASIMKSRLFGALCNKFNLKKLSKNSHLFTSKDLIDFPGRKFLLKHTVPYNKPIIKKTYRNTKANVSVRNFPESVSIIKKKWNIRDGGDKYLFFTTLQNKSKVILDCEKI